MPETGTFASLTKMPETGTFASLTKMYIFGVQFTDDGHGISDAVTRRCPRLQDLELHTIEGPKILDLERLVVAASKLTEMQVVKCFVLTTEPTSMVLSLPVLEQWQDSSPGEIGYLSLPSQILKLSLIELSPSYLVLCDGHLRNADTPAKWRTGIGYVSGYRYSLDTAGYVSRTIRILRRYLRDTSPIRDPRFKTKSGDTNARRAAATASLPHAFRCRRHSRAASPPLPPGHLAVAAPSPAAGEARLHPSSEFCTKRAAESGNRICCFLRFEDNLISTRLCLPWLKISSHPVTLIAMAAHYKPGVTEGSA
ncbi:hypothetical protein EJB05_12126, partial [Eragrostis curvula]